MEENEIGREIVDAAFHVHKGMGPGLLESVYEAVLFYELGKRGLKTEKQVPVSFEYDGHWFSDGFRADMVVEKRVLVELKSVETTLPVHRKQTLTYLKLSKLRLGFLINFGAPVIKDGIFRLSNGMPDVHP